MGLDLQRLLGVTLYRAFDTDRDGRILAGSDETGSTQLIEISPGRQRERADRAARPCSGRYVPGERTVIVSHDDGGNERHQLSLLAADRRRRPAGPGDLQPLVRDPRYIHLLADVGARPHLLLHQPA